MDVMKASRQVTRVVSEGTGLSQEEIGVLVVAGAVAATVLGLVRMVDVLVEVWPDRTGRVGA